MPITRRQHLQRGLALSTSLISGKFLQAATKNASKSDLKASLAAYSLRDRLTGKVKPPMDLLQFVDYCAELKLPGTELTSYYFPPKVTPDYLRELKQRVTDRGLEVSGGAIRNDFCQMPGKKLDDDIAHTKRWLEHYAALNAPSIRIFAGNVPKGSMIEEASKRCADVINRLCEEAAKFKVKLALENHGGITDRADDMLAIVKQINSPWFGVNLDGGNFRVGPDPYAELEKIAPYACNVQVKVDMYRNKTQHELADFRKIVAILRKHHYRGWVALEYEAKPDPMQAIPKHIADLKQALAD